MAYSKILSVASGIVLSAYASFSNAVIDQSVMDDWSITTGTITAECPAGTTVYPCDDNDSGSSGGFYQAMIPGDGGITYFQTIITEDPGPVINYGFSGTISGGEAGNKPPVNINIYDPNGELVTSGTSDSNGDYKIEVEEFGEYYIEYEGTGEYLGQVYGGDWCTPDVECDVLSGDLVETVDLDDPYPLSFEYVQKGNIYDILYADGYPRRDIHRHTLNKGAVIRGKVNASDTGETLGGFVYRIMNKYGYYLDSNTTNPDGSYSAVVSRSDEFLIEVVGWEGYAGQIYGGPPCTDCDHSNGTPIEVTLGSTTENIDFNLSLGGSIRGHVGLPDAGEYTEYGRVFVYSIDGQQLWAGGVISEDGSYQIDSLATGEYYLVAQHDQYDRTRDTQGEYLDYVYGGEACLRYKCNAILGELVSVVAGEVTDGIDFSLIKGGKIEGTVSFADGEEVSGRIRLGLFDPMSERVSEVFTKDGTFVFEGLGPGSYYVRAWGSGNYMGQVYGGDVCSRLAKCDFSKGILVDVNPEEVISNIDIALARGGTISGTVYEKSSNAATDRVYVTLFDKYGTAVASAVTNSEGRYEFTALPDEKYFLGATGVIYSVFDECLIENENGECHVFSHTSRVTNQKYISQVYGNSLCENDDRCVVDGEGIEIAQSGVIENIDFHLVEGGKIWGTVIAGDTGLPMEYGLPIVINTKTGVTKYPWTDKNGRFALLGLSDGEYRVSVTSSFHSEYIGYRESGSSRYVPEMVVEIKDGSVSSNILLEIHKGAVISGFVTSATSGEVLIPRVWVNGASLDRDYQTGEYSFRGLPPGEHTIHVGATEDHIAHGIQKTISVGLGEIVSNIDFSLSVGGSSTGQILSTRTGEPVAGAVVSVFDLAGNPIITFPGRSDYSGSFVVGGLPTGSYILKVTSQDDTHVGRIVGGDNCAVACDFSKGTPVSVVAGERTEGVDFSLDVGGRVTGIVEGSFSDVANRRILFFSPQGEFVAGEELEISGVYYSSSFVSGDYYVVAKGKGNIPDYLYGAGDCSIVKTESGYESKCDFSKGQLVSVSQGNDTSNIDFSFKAKKQGTGDEPPPDVELPVEPAPAGGGGVVTWLLLMLLYTRICSVRQRYL